MESVADTLFTGSEVRSFGSPRVGFRKEASPHTFRVAFIPDRTTCILGRIAEFPLSPVSPKLSKVEAALGGRESHLTQKETTELSFLQSEEQSPSLW